MLQNYSCFKISRNSAWRERRTIRYLGICRTTGICCLQPWLFITWIPDRYQVGFVVAVTECPVLHFHAVRLVPYPAVSVVPATGLWFAAVW